MIDPTSRPGHEDAGSSRRIVFDPASPSTQAAGAAVPGAVLLLVSDPDRRWAAETAIELATDWARGGRRVVVADLHLEGPVLHEIAGTPNLEGVVDVFLYGASLSRSAHPVRGRGFYLISAGTYEPDAEAIYRNPRWTKLVAGFRDAGASLVLFAPADSADLTALAPHVSRTILLGDGAGVGGALAADTVLVPPTAGEWLGAPDPEPTMAASVLSPAAEADRELLLPPAPVRPTRRSRRGVYLVLALVLMMALLAGAGYWVSRYRPDLLPGFLAPAPAADPVAAAPAAAGAAVQPSGAPVPAGDTLPYSIQVIAYQAIEPATEQVARQRREFGEVPFFVSPEVIQGLLYFKVLAGALPDTVAAHALREQLVAAGAVDEDDAAGSWDLIQSVPLTFDVGQFASIEEARATADSLSSREIPVYALPIPFSDGSHRWQLYSGAYRDSATAEPMRARLVAAGVPARLVRRAGAAASGPAQEAG